METPLPLIKEIPYREPVDCFAKFAHQKWAIFLDSAKITSYSGQYSIIALDPFLTLSSKNDKILLDGKIFHGDPLLTLQQLLLQYQFSPEDFLPNFLPFFGGAIGYLGYDLCHHLEKLPHPLLDDRQFHDLAIGFYDVVFVFDHFICKSWIISNGFPESTPKNRLYRAIKRANYYLEKYECKTPPTEAHYKNVKKIHIQSNFTKPLYELAVQRIIDYIYAGDIFQANLSQRFTAHLPDKLSPFLLYKTLRRINPASFAAYLSLPNTILASASPERFLKLSGSDVETHPIKGTKPRGSYQEEDDQLVQALLNSEKDLAENTMIVDLMRNDLSKVCNANSVHVPWLCRVETLATVHHLVSTVIGKLQPGLGAIDLIRATFPGGSITGAPKIRAMEIITEVEGIARGPYCGSIGYIGFDGEMDLSIIIRTYAIKDQVITFQGGGAIVADSNPSDEYEETLAKTKPLAAALLNSEDIYGTTD